MGLAVAVAIVITLLLLELGAPGRAAAKDTADDSMEGPRRRRIATIAGLASATLQVLLWIVILFYVLAAFGVPLGPLFASAGVAGVALGFGAQTLVRDTLAGLFIALEGQFDVGDVIELQTEGGPVSGTIEGLTLRHHLGAPVRRHAEHRAQRQHPGHEQQDARLGAGDRRRRVALTEDPDRVREALEDLLGELADEEPLRSWLREAPSVLGVVQLTDVAQVERVVAQTRPGNRLEAERFMRERITARITEQGIKVPPVTGTTGSRAARASGSERGADRSPVRCACRGFPFASVDELQAALGEHPFADRGLATAIYLSLSLGKPLLLEGEAGVGKTEVAKVLAQLLGRELIRLQCYEGIDASQALYEWNYSRQLIAVRAMDAADATTHVEDLFGEDFLVERPLLAAIGAGDRAVLLVDELDRADDEFEAFLLEILSEFAVTVPEIGRVGAETPPAVVVTSNRTRELHDALKRRCLYHWIDHPQLDREVAIVRTRAPHVSESLARDVARAVARLRELDLAKLPGSPRRSTGRTRSRSWAPTGSPSRWRSRRSAPS